MPKYCQSFIPSRNSLLSLSLKQCSYNVNIHFDFSGTSFCCRKCSTNFLTMMSGNNASGRVNIPAKWKIFWGRLIKVILDPVWSSFCEIPRLFQKHEKVKHIFHHLLIFIFYWYNLFFLQRWSLLRFILENIGGIFFLIRIFFYLLETRTTWF